ncbi:uncharacterized protein LOC126901518 isoform X2 [Daktulosphaira vitifoliae]|nr:uncharacterized protein LOC126901518 isoform X2 [Daktulosphaira vitifoliae]XP_050533982.1 uncharacterized protein LOC126901518 isoform X2 [Daktulosphaira vitifoliae]
MPLKNSVSCLQFLALQKVCNYVLDVALEMKKDSIGSREYFIRSTHAWARTNIISCTKEKLDKGEADKHIWNELNGVIDTNPILKIMNAQFNRWLIILNAMLDVGVTRLPSLYFYSGMEAEFHDFVLILNRCNTHLKELSLTFQMSSKNDYTPIVYNSMFKLQNSLKDGLASKLVFLKLGAICDNAILQTIGENAICLKHLDISGSWNVDEIGIKHLLFKKDVSVETNNVSNDKLCQQLGKLYENKRALNKCCFTLEELRIQDTNTEDASLLMILACVKSLRALGGFLYFRNIGDAIVTLWENSPKVREFQLTELYDMQLTGKKIAVLKECLPYLKKLYTRLSCVCSPQDFADPEQGSMFWGRVQTLTIDLDYMMNFHFINFIYNYGCNLSELTILDQEADIDVAKVLSSCPNLLFLKGYLHTFETPVGKFIKLKSFELHMPTVETINWFFENCPCLEEAKLFSDSRHLYWNSQVFEKPPAIMCNKLKRLEISFNDKHSIISQKTVYKFIDKCSKLQYLGCLNTWSLDKNFVDMIKLYVKKNNYDLNIN